MIACSAAFPGSGTPRQASYSLPRIWQDGLDSAALGRESKRVNTIDPQTRSITVRDHGQPCEHGSLWPHWTNAAKAKWWQEPECLGGKEMILDRVRDGVWREVEANRNEQRSRSADDDT